MKNLSNLEIAKQVEKAIQTGNVDEILKYLAADFVWEVYGNNDYPLAGIYIGADRLRNLFRLFGELATNIKKYEAQEYISQGDKVIVLGEAELCWFGGSTLATKWIHVISIKDSKILEFREARG